MPVSEFGAWAVSHMGSVKSGVTFNPDAPAQAYSDPTIHAKVMEYTESVRALRGPDVDLRTHPLETVVIVRRGQGRQHGRLWIADGAQSSASAPSLSDVRARSTSSSLPIRARPTATLSRVDELTAELLQTKESHVQLTAQHAQLTTQVAQLTAQVTQLIQTIGQGQAMPAVAHYTPPPSVCSNAHQTSPAVDPVNPSPTSGRPPFESLPQ